MFMDAWLLHRGAKPCLFLALCVPLAYLVWAALADQLGANPAEALI
ncbi:MAG: sulfoxide reductase heme-binding subunit YedZ, partial [Curvibacter sp.]